MSERQTKTKGGKNYEKEREKKFTDWNHIPWALFASLTIIGIVKIRMVYFKFEQGKKIITSLSAGLSIIAVLFLAMAREQYTITVMFLLLLIKGGLLYKQAKAGQ